MYASELDYDLPPELIAQAPLDDREASRLLCMQRAGSSISHRSIGELPELLPPSSLIVLNDTKVIPARLHVRKASGGRVELLLVECISPAGTHERWLALGKPLKGLVAGMPLHTDDAELRIVVVALREHGEVEVELQAACGVTAALARVGQIPLPPYIRRTPDASDLIRYQTVFAANEGAVAAPTAGLHLTDALLARLRARGHELAFVTLHVGPGTFAPLRSEDLSQHVMHAERYHVPDATASAIATARRQGRKLLAVGTTVVRALESVANEQGEVSPGTGQTSIFIHPPYRFRVVDTLLTNFHWPRSTLLALVMAFGGIEPVRQAYAQAVASRYRFFSYGDAMLIGGEHA